LRQLESLVLEHQRLAKYCHQPQDVKVAEISRWHDGKNWEKASEDFQKVSKTKIQRLQALRI
jgi:hypothetical protein